MPAETIPASTASNEVGRVSSMRFLYQAELLSVLVVSLLASGQESTEPTSHVGPPPLEVRLTKGPLWKDNCLELGVQRTNVSKSSIFLDATYSEGIKIYSSVNDATNTLGQGTGEAWMLVYGWTDVVSEPTRLAPGARRQNTFCIGETFAVKETGKETLRQVRVQGKLRIVAEYERKTQTRRMTDQPQRKMRRTYVLAGDNSNRWTLGEVVLDIPIPCPNGMSKSDCLFLPPIFPGEHDIWTIEPEPPPVFEVQPPPIPTFPVIHPPPPKP